jgi:hypothetical protein
MNSDPITFRKLTIAKQIYLDATRQPSSLSAVARIIAVVEYDLAIETALKAVLGSLQPAKVPPDRFADLIQQVDHALTNAALPPVPLRAAIQQVHNIRNDAQHQARYPSDVEVSDCRTYARDFLTDLIMQVWGLAFGSLHLGDLVEDATARGWLVEAEDALVTGDLPRAVMRAGEALQFALEQVEHALVGHADPWEPEPGIVVEDPFGNANADRDLGRAFRRMQETVLYLALGLDYADYVRFKAVAGDVSLLRDGTADHHGMKEPVEISEAEYAVGYASEAAVRIEGRVGDLARPFGRGFWY